MRNVTIMLAVVAVLGLVALPAYAGLFKIDFTDCAAGGGTAANWDNTLNTYADGTTFNLTDWSGSGDNDVTMTFSSANGYSMKQSAAPAGDPPAGTTYTIDGISVTYPVHADNGYGSKWTGGTPAQYKDYLFEFKNLNPSANKYKVSIFAGRNNFQEGAIWVGAAGNDPGSANTGDYSSNDAYTSCGITKEFTVATGDSIFFRHYEDGSSGPTGMIIRLVPEPATLALLGLGGIGVLLRRRRK